MRDHLGLVLTAEMEALEPPEPPRQERLQEVPRNAFQKGQDEPKRELGGFRERKSRAGESGPLQRPREYGMEMKGFQGTVIK